MVTVQAQTSPDVFAVLQRTIEENVQEGLSRLVHSAIRKGVVAASHATPTREAEAAETGSEQEIVSRPVEGGRCAKVWDALDSITKDGTVPTLQEVQKLAKRKRWNANTARVQYYRWRAAQPAANAS